MKYLHARERYKSSMHFNLTPLIDIIFLLNMFFMLACSFIIFKNFKVQVPQDCPAAVLPDKIKESTITISVFPEHAEAGRVGQDGPNAAPAKAPVTFALREQKFADDGNPEKLVTELAQAIRRSAGDNPDQLIHLRADRNLEYQEVQNALIALAQAGQKRIQLAAIQDQPGGQP